MKLRIWTLFGALVVVIAFGLALPTLLSDKTAEVAINYEQVKADFKAEFIEGVAALHYSLDGDTAADPAAANPDGSDPAADPAANQAAAATTAAPDGTATGNGTGSGEASNSDANNQNGAGAQAANQAATEITEADTPLGGGDTKGNGLYVKDGWINQKINENREKINDADLTRGADIYNSLDTDFIFSLADGGLTPEERAQVDNYLKSKLGGSDYELAKSLYFKYVGLLNND